MENIQNILSATLEPLVSGVALQSQQKKLTFVGPSLPGFVSIGPVD
jgi:hypothetical protein